LATRIAAAFSILLALTAALADDSAHHEEVSFLPATTGDPLTVKPIDLPDVHCSIVGWDKSGNKPVLTLLCPPKAIFAPLRVYVKLSRTQSGEADTYQDIVAQTNAPTKLHTTKRSAWVWLGVRKANQKIRDSWVPFDAVVDVALVEDSPR
jgi:hypothetical protein